MPVYQVHLVNPARGLDIRVPCRGDQPILEAAEAAGIDLPYSCRSAACATCAGKLLEGTVRLDEQFILSERDLEQGYTCLCSAVPTSDCRVLTHQQSAVETV